MDLTRKILIYAVFIGLGFLAFTLRAWVIGDRRVSFKDELKYSLVVLLAFAAIAAIIIYLNNKGH